jgi:hypothetical protein
MHPVHNGISARHQKRRTLDKPCQKIESFFPAFTRGIHLMRRKPVEKKGVKKQGKEPMTKEKNQDSDH